MVNESQEAVHEYLDNRVEYGGLPATYKKNLTHSKQSLVYPGPDFIPRRILCVCLLFVIGLMTGCENEHSRKNYTIGVVCLNGKLLSIVDGFKGRLAELGHVEGENITYLSECPLKDKSHIKSALDGLIAKKVDLLFTMSTPITKKALKATEGKEIPIVFTPVYNVVGSGLVDNLLNHGKNITGVQVRGSTPKTLEWLLTISPTVQNLLVPINEADPAAGFGLMDLQEAAEKLGVRLLIAKVSSTEELTAVLKHPPEKMDAIWILHGNYMVPRLHLYIEAATRYQVPLASPTAQYKQGVMITYGQRYERTGGQVGRLAHKLLHGVSPKDLPIETPDFFLGLNLKTAELAGISISDDVLRQAEDIAR